jgi:hypothetical protein
MVYSCQVPLELIEDLDGTFGATCTMEFYGAFLNVEWHKNSQSVF